MTMAIEPADDETFDDVFDRGSREDVKTPEPDTAEKPSQPRDDSGRFASKQEPAPVEQASNDPVPDPALASPDKPPQDREPHHVPLSELKAERKRRQEFEQQLVEARARAQALEQLFQQQQRQPQTQPQPQEEVPDAFSDPQGYVSHVLSQERERQRNQMLNVYEEIVRARYGDEKVSAAFSAAQAAGIVPRLVQQTNPWATLMQWHQDHVVKQEVGSDLEAFKKKIADEAVQKAMAGLKSGSQAQQQQRFPGSLAAATATGEQGAVLTEKAAVNDIFGSDRRARRQA